MDKTPFNEWFDISNKDHLLAYKHLITTGEWPKHFIPADVELEHPGWQQLLDKRVVLRYIEMMTQYVTRSQATERPRPEFS